MYIIPFSNSFPFHLPFLIKLSHTRLHLSTSVYLSAHVKGSRRVSRNRRSRRNRLLFARSYHNRSRLMKAFIPQKTERRGRGRDQKADGSRVTSVANAENLVVRFECYSRRITVSMAYKSVRSTLLNARASRLQPASESTCSVTLFLFQTRARDNARCYRRYVNNARAFTERKNAARRPALCRSITTKI